MKLPRPHIPFAVRLKVAQRQLAEFGIVIERPQGETLDVYLDHLLAVLALELGDKLFEPLHLDHNPALCNRTYNKVTHRYRPSANDPKYLIYRTQLEHDIKTRVRGDGAQYSDLALLRKNKRIAKRILTGKRPKYGVSK